MSWLKGSWLELRLEVNCLGGRYEKVARLKLSLEVNCLGGKYERVWVGVGVGGSGGL